MADFTLVHKLPISGPGDVNYRRMEVVDKADKGVGNSNLHVLFWVDQGGRNNCGQLIDTDSYTTWPTYNTVQYKVSLYVIMLSCTTGTATVHLGIDFIILLSLLER